MTGGTALEILDISKDSFKLNVPNFLSVLKKVGDVPLVLYSINGKTRTGKSFALNFFIRYFEAQKAQVKDWVNFDTQGKFVWQSGRERTTKGINLWSEPYFVQDPQNNGRKVAVLLMDTQGLFDEQTTPRQNAIIFALSSLCSSVSIFNLMKNVDESVLQDLEYYADYAHHVSAADRRSKDGVKKGVKEEAFQMLVFLVRDFDFPEYNYGVHDMHSTKPSSPNNFCRDIFETNGKREVDEQNLLVRENILKAYKDVAMCLMPYPGSKFVRQEGQLIRPDSDFDENMANFVQVMTSPSHLVTKKMGGVELSGTDFAKYVEGWAKLCEDAANSFPKAMTVAQANAAIQNTLVCKTAFANFEKSLQGVMDGRPDGMEDGELQKNIEKFRDEALTYFDKAQKLGSSVLHDTYRDMLVHRIDKFGETSKIVNHMKIDKALAETRRKELMAGLSDLNSQMDKMKQASAVEKQKMEAQVKANERAMQEQMEKMRHASEAEKERMAAQLKANERALQDQMERMRIANEEEQKRMAAQVQANEEARQRLEREAREREQNSQRTLEKRKEEEEEDSGFFGVLKSVVPWIPVVGPLMGALGLFKK